MSEVGLGSCLEGTVLYNLAVICSFVCYCNKDGGQVCVDGLLLIHNKIKKESQILIEHPYYIPEKGTPIPLISKGGWEDLIPSILDAGFVAHFPSIGRLVGAARLAKTGGISDDVMAAYLKRQINYQGIREKGYAEGEILKLSKGELSFPDTVIVADRNKPAIGGNMLGVGEIKFPPDTWHEGQYQAATKIAGGDKEKVHTLTPESCKCAGKKQGLDESAGQPAFEAAAIRANAANALSVFELTASFARFLSGGAKPVSLFFEILLTPTRAY